MTMFYLHTDLDFDFGCVYSVHTFVIDCHPQDRVVVGARSCRLPNFDYV